MKATSRLGIVIVTCIAFGCAEYREEHLSVGQSLASHSVKNLQLYPVYANHVFLENHKGIGNYLTLQQAIKQKKVVVSEHIASSDQNQSDLEPDVNTLFIENTSSDMVVILNGEVVTGGNQDCMIAQDVILPPHSGQLDLSVFCVEQGRWSGDETLFSVAETSLAPSGMRPVSLAAPDQEEVWEAVDVNLNELKVESHTRALMDLNVNEDYVKQLKSYVNKLEKVFTEEKDVVGVIAVSGGKIIGCDLFATTNLFAAHYPNLLQSYAAEAVIAEQRLGLTQIQVENFLQTLLNDDKRSLGFLKRSGQPNKKHRPVHLSAI